MKVVINACFGGFGLSERAFERLIELGVPRVPYLASVYRVAREITDYKHPETSWDESHKSPERQQSLIRMCGRYTSDWFRQYRDDELLVRVVEELGDAANGGFAKLRVVEIPDGTQWEIDEYDGRESVHETHRSWS